MTATSLVSGLLDLAAVCNYGDFQGNGESSESGREFDGDFSGNKFEPVDFRGNFDFSRIDRVDA